MIDGYSDIRVRDLALQQTAEPEREAIVQAIKSELDANPCLWEKPIRKGYYLPPKRRRLFVDLDCFDIF